MRTLATALTLVLLLPFSAAHAQSFGIFFGDERDDLFPREPRLALCMTDRQIRDAVADAGYDNIALNAPNEDHVQVRATRDGAVYLLDFNACTGRIEDERRLR
ncbi:hypothetical protein [Devosia submarina]|uniref:hypothetical protein n=1 Tax=Devosia submarina TaxID=1173082 RepID=UPI000D36767D|nr:hypothetical protein [Devosia submarina]